MSDVDLKHDDTAAEVLAALRTPPPAVVSIVELEETTFSPAFRGMILGLPAPNDAPPQPAPELKTVKHIPLYPARVAVVDEFFSLSGAPENFSQNGKELYDIDGDGKSDKVCHGDLVRIFAGDDEHVIVPFPTEPGRDQRTSHLEQLGAVLERRQNGERFDALVYSWELSRPRTDEDRRKPFDREEARSRLVAERERDQSAAHALKVIELLEAIAQAGVRVYTISGNSGGDAINLYSLARGVEVIGGSETNDRAEPLSGSPTITARTKSSFVTKAAENDAGSFTGIDVDGDGDPDVEPDRLTAQDDERNSVVLNGSSFAAPTKCREDLRTPRPADPIARSN